MAFSALLRCATHWYDSLLKLKPGSERLIQHNVPVKKKEIPIKQKSNLCLGKIKPASENDLLPVNRPKKVPVEKRSENEKSSR